MMDGCLTDVCLTGGCLTDVDLTDVRLFQSYFLFLCWIRALLEVLGGRVELWINIRHIEYFI